eukprot:594916-Pyramimonas_sp.AAC.1
MLRARRLKVSYRSERRTAEFAKNPGRRTCGSEMRRLCLFERESCALSDDMMRTCGGFEARLVGSLAVEKLEQRDSLDHQRCRHRSSATCWIIS